MFPLLSSSIFIVAIVVDDGSSIANQLLLFTLSSLIVNVRVMCCDFIRLTSVFNESNESNKDLFSRMITFTRKVCDTKKKLPTQTKKPHETRASSKTLASGTVHFISYALFTYVRTQTRKKCLRHF